MSSVHGRPLLTNQPWTEFIEGFDMVHVFFYIISLVFGLRGLIQPRGKALESVRFWPDTTTQKDSGHFQGP
jgi:hypothetical protein